MNTKTLSVNKHIAKLPVKYAIMSVSTFLHRGNKDLGHISHNQIDKQYMEFIELPNDINQT